MRDGVSEPEKTGPLLDRVNPSRSSRFQMLVTTNPQRTLWETILPPAFQDLTAELAAVDALLDDPVRVARRSRSRPTCE